LLFWPPSCSQTSQNLQNALNYSDSRIWKYYFRNKKARFGTQKYHFGSCVPKWFFFQYFLDFGTWLLKLSDLKHKFWNVWIFVLFYSILLLSWRICVKKIDFEWINFIKLNLNNFFR
jgi:hypothetical protein